MKDITPQQLEIKKAKRREAVAKYRASHPYDPHVNKAYREKHKDELNSLSRERYARNPEKYRKASLEYYYKHRLHYIERAKAWSKNNRDRANTAYHLRVLDNPVHRPMINAIRKARNAGLLHPRHDRAVEERLRIEAQDLTISTGIKHQIDHIIPTQMGGWHHHQNMQIIPGDINRRKNMNPFWEHPKYKSWKDVPCELWPEQLKLAYGAMLLTSHKN